MIRRHFLALVASLITLPPLASAKQGDRPLATIRGIVVGNGLRFGKLTEKNPSGRYPTTTVRTNAFVWLSHLTKEGPGHQYTFKLFASTRTDDLGMFKFDDLPGGWYCINDTQLVHVWRNAIYNVTLKQAQ